MSQIITTTDLATYTSQTLNAGLASQVVSAVNGYIENITHRVWGETLTITETYDFGKTLWLRQMDIQSIESIKFGWPNADRVTATEDSYYFNRFGRVTLLWEQIMGIDVQSVFYNDFIEVTYTYGVEHVPADLKEAALGVALGFYNWAQADGKEVVSSSVGSYRVEYSGAVRGSGSGPEPYKDTAEAHWVTIKSYAKARL